ncbi:hypothetical protein J2W51_000132 [Tardiphaga robiniae]|uniref:hypothetical protein n=1 Tax=Tardiphaga robiniae TaxID=943830 RepID=UPI0028601527|nr:hypothetical protein [Tardiphaga robiniae]MDR6657590.1 hypothetical protein [Tardiphaga robiniae]
MVRQGLSFQSWTIADALERIGPALPAALDERRLVLFGRPDSIHAEATYFPFPDLSPEFSFIEGPSVGHAEATCAGIDVYEISIYPVLKAPNVVEILGDLPLKTAFERLILGDPEVEWFGPGAVSDLPKLAHVYCAGEQRQRYWPLNSDNLLEIGELDDSGKYFGYLPTARTEAASQALRDRLAALTYLLRESTFCIEGDPADASSPRVASPSHWLGMDLWLDLTTGDVVQELVYDDGSVEAHRFDDGRQEFRVRWRAAMLRKSRNLEGVQYPRFAMPVQSVRVEPKAASLASCKRWLRQQMLTTPNDQQKSKNAWLQEAKQRWADLSVRAFFGIWDELLRVRIAPGWGRAGRRREINRRGD